MAQGLLFLIVEMLFQHSSYIHTVSFCQTHLSSTGEQGAQSAPTTPWLKEKETERLADTWNLLQKGTC